MDELPLIDAPIERADARRNRERILCAAERLLESSTLDCVSVDRIAAEAGVGKGTVFRRFGDRVGLLRAVLSDREAAFQERLIRGEPPLGPGAPALERLLAFGPAYLAFVVENGAILAAAQTGARQTDAPYVFLHTHLGHLLREAAPGLDPDYVADVLLAILRADLVLHQHFARGFSLERLSEGWCGIAYAASTATARD
jgi:AcrR family transcriptional regulator